MEIKNIKLDEWEIDSFYSTKANEYYTKICEMLPDSNYVILKRKKAEPMPEIKAGYKIHAQSFVYGTESRLLFAKEDQYGSLITAWDINGTAVSFDKDRVQLIYNCKDELIWERK